MSNYTWCHGPNCHTRHTQDRIRGVKGSKVLRTRKVLQNAWNQDTFFSKFCSNSCYNEFANKYINEITAIAPRTECLETPIDVVVETKFDYYDNEYKVKVIKEVDNNTNP